MKIEDIFNLKTEEGEEKIRRKILVRITVLTAFFGYVWGGLYFFLELDRGGFSVLSYSVLATLNLAYFALTGNYKFFRLSMLILILLLPFGVSLALGSFTASSGVILASMLSPLGALMFFNVRTSRVLFYAFAVLVVIGGAYEYVFPELVYEVDDLVVTLFFAMNIIVISAISYSLLEYFVKQRDYYQELLAQRNKDLTDSITYATHIQNAIFPTDAEMTEALGEHFVFFRPKDIVSGDFYWMAEEDGLLHISAVDCTGHGVPGAMVSVLGANALNRAVKEFGNTRPSEILESVTKVFNDSFRKSRDRVNDGMDLALCTVDRTKEKIYFSGAYNPLYILRSNQYLSESKSLYSESVEKREMRLDEYEDCHILEFTSTKVSIGRFSGEVAFKEWQIDYKAGDMVYLFSDGYADQFGGRKGKKFKYKRFKNILGRHYNSPMERVQLDLENEHEAWRGDLEQLDDIVVIGARL